MSGLFPLVVENATVRRRAKTLVGPVDLRLEAQGITIVMGPNGSGKTSLLRMLHGIARLSEGRVNWNVAPEIAQAAQAFVFQTPIMLRRSVADNLAYPLRTHGVSKSVARQKAREWAMRVGIDGILQRQATNLSGGERQKLALARGMIREPKVLFLDEPCAALDGRATREIEQLLHQIAADGTRLIMSTHDMGQARRLADDVVFLLSGRVHETGAARDFFKAPQTEAAQAFLRGDIVE